MIHRTIFPQISTPASIMENNNKFLCLLWISHHLLFLRKLASREPKPKLVVVNKSKATTKRTFDTTTLGVQPKTAKAENTKSRPEADKRPDEDKCKYTCQESGGCSVRILPRSGFVSGKSMGYGNYNCYL